MPTGPTEVPEGRRGHRPRRESARRRRDALLRAAVEIAGEEGAAAVTHRGVAARAGVPLATTSYFFASIHELLAEALRAFGAARAAELDRLADELTEEQTSPEEMADRFAELLLRRERSAELAEIECYLHAARSPELRSAVAEVSAAYERVAAVALAAAGAPDPEGRAPAFKAVVDGFVLAHLVTPRPDDRGRLAEALLALFTGFGGRQASVSASSSASTSSGSVEGASSVSNGL